MLIVGVWLTSIQLFACCLGLRKKVPSTRGYLSKTSICSSHKMHWTRDRPSEASVDKMKQRVSSLPWLPSSSICNRKRNIFISIIREQKTKKTFFIIIWDRWIYFVIYRTVISVTYAFLIKTNICIVI